MSGKVQGIIYSNGQITDVGTLANIATNPSGINNSGQVTGSSAILPGGPYYHAFLYSNNQISDLDVEGYYSFANAINDSGQVTGQRSSQLGFSHAFLYSDGQMNDLRTLAGSNSSSIGRAINNKGQIVGTSSSFPNVNQAFIYSDGQMMNLNALIDPSLGITLTDATGINDEGQIVANTVSVGTGFFAGRSYLLTPTSNVPEPSTWALLGIPSLLLLGWSKYRSVVF